MNDKTTQSIRESYDRLADEYTRQIFNILQNKPLDRELLNRFAAELQDAAKYVIWVVAQVT